MYYTVEIDMKDGRDAPEKNFTYYDMAKACYDSIKLTNSVVYKSLSKTTRENGTEILEREG